MNRFHYFQISKFWFFKSALLLSDRFWANILYVFWGQITTENLSLCWWEITKKSFRRKWLKNFHLLTLWIWLFGIFDKPPQGCNQVKNSMGLLQGPRLMAWTTKSPIRGNHWVPLGCRALLGSVNSQTFNIEWTLLLFVKDAFLTEEKKTHWKCLKSYWQLCRQT